MQAKEALIFELQIEEGFDADLVSIMEQYTIDGLQREYAETWCGCAVLTDIFSNKMLLVVLLNGTAACDQLEQSGFVPQQIANFASYLTATPIIRRCSVHVRTCEEVRCSDQSD